MKNIPLVISDPFSHWTTLNSHAYEYNSGHQRTKQTFMGGNYMDYTYDNIGQLKTAMGKESSGTARLHEKFGYAYDAAWNLNQRTNNALVQTFNVDNRNQLTTGSRSGILTVAGAVSATPTSVTVRDNANSPASATVYDDNTFARQNITLLNGNNTFTAVAEDGYGRKDTNTVTVNLPASPSYTYDARGNLVSDGQRGFVYDDENQLIRVTVTNGWKSEFAYDGMMRRRVSKEFTWTGSAWVLTNEVRYVYDGRLVVQERNANNLPLVTYTRGNDLSGTRQGAGGIGGMLARSEMSNVQSPHAYYHADGNGNITAMATTNGALAARYHFDPYGNLLGMAGPLAEVNLYRFSSKEFHPNSGLVYYLYRYYEPKLHRWVNEDPLGNPGSLTLVAVIISPRVEIIPDRQFSSEELFSVWISIHGNLYAALANNPVHIFDPYGLVCWPQLLKGVGALAGGAVAIAVGSVASTVGVGVVGVVGGAIAVQYGLGNVVAAFSDDRETAQKMLESPSDLGGAIGRAVGGEKGQEIGSMLESVVNLPGAIKKGDFLGGAKSGTDVLDSAIGAAGSKSDCK